MVLIFWDHVSGVDEQKRKITAQCTILPAQLAYITNWGMPFFFFSFIILRTQKSREIQISNFGQYFLFSANYRHPWQCWLCTQYEWFTGYNAAIYAQQTSVRIGLCSGIGI